MHSDAFTGETQEPFHRRAGEVRSARRRIDVSANAGAHDTAATVDEIAVETGMVVRVFFHDTEMSAWRFMSALARRNRSVGDNLFTDHQVSALFGNGNNDVGGVRGSLSEQCL